VTHGHDGDTNITFLTLTKTRHSVPTKCIRLAMNMTRIIQPVIPMCFLASL